MHVLSDSRISVVFRVRSAQRIKISDTDLVKRLLIIVFIFGAYCAARTMAGMPTVVTGTPSLTTHYAYMTI